jgi:hypothetical protein
MSRRAPLCGGQKLRCSTATAYGAARDRQRRIAGGSISGAMSFHDIKSVVETGDIQLARQDHAQKNTGIHLFPFSNDGGLITSVAGLTDTDYTVFVG